MAHSENPPQSLSRRQFIGTTLAVGSGLSITPLGASATPPIAKPDRTICIFSKHLQWLSIPDMAQTASKLGFAGVDLTVRKGGHIEPERVVDELPKAVTTIRKAGLDVPMIATDVIDADHPLTESVLRTAHKLGIPYYRTAYLKYDPQLGVAKSLEQHKKQLQKLARLNQKYTIHGAYQNHAGTNVGAAVWDLWEVLKDIDPRWLGCQYDIKHAVAEGGQSWVNGLDLLKSHIRCMDMKDFVWSQKNGKWQHQLVPLGTGMVDFNAYFGKLKQYSISGPMSIHYEYPLGGAETGKTTINVPPDEVLSAMQRDLRKLQELLAVSQLSE